MVIATEKQTNAMWLYASRFRRKKKRKEKEAGNNEIKMLQRVGCQ